MALLGPPNINRMKTKKNVKGLIKALSFREDVDICKNAAIALGEIADTLAIAPLVSTLKNGFIIPIQEAAAKALGEIANPLAIEPLMDVLKDDHNWDSVRRAAAKSLIKINPNLEEDELLRLAIFETVITHSPERAMEVLFEEALPATPYLSPETIQRYYEDVRVSWSSQKLLKGSLNEIKDCILSNLRIRQYDSIEVGTVLYSYASQVSLSHGDYFSAIRVWHSGNSFFACGSADFGDD